MTTTTPPQLSSYPSLLRRSQTFDGCQPDPVDVESDPDSDSDGDSLPVVDFQKMSPQNIGEACREWGMFRLVNHQVPPELILEIHRCAAELFSLPFQHKQVFPTAPILYFWGSPALSIAGNASNAGPCSNNLNFLEGFDAPLGGITQFQYEDPRLDSFKCLLEKYGSHQTRLAAAIFSAMSRDLCLPETKSSSYLSTSTATLRVYRYLRRPSSSERWGIPAHTDSSVISIIHQDEVGGLQVCRNNKWFHVQPVLGTLIVNIGDMMQGISNDEYISVRHRVKLNQDRERISLGYFVFPAENAVIESSKYRPFTYAEFQASKDIDLMNLGFKIGLPRFRVD